MRLLILLLCATLASVAQPKSSLQISVVPQKDVKADVEVPFQITIKDAKGALVAGAEVEVVATMVDMNHGEFKYQAKPATPGIYRFAQTFVMGGSWNLAIKARKGADAQTVTKKIEVKD